MRKGTPNQFIKELTEKIDELKEGVKSSSVIIDDGEDVIEADEDVEDFSAEDEETEELDEEEVEVEDESSDEEFKTITVESAPAEGSEESEAEEDTSSEYLTGLYRSVEKELNDLIQSVEWTTDEDNVYMDVNFADGHIFTFTIPKADLSYDIQTQDKDIEYICYAVRDSQEPSEVVEEESFEAVEDEPYNMEDYYSEEDRPAYL